MYQNLSLDISAAQMLFLGTTFGNKWRSFVLSSASPFAGCKLQSLAPSSVKPVLTFGTLCLIAPSENLLASVESVILHAYSIPNGPGTIGGTKHDAKSTARDTINSA
jgi:hypothetical protein